MPTIRDDVRELVRAFRRYTQRGAWDGDQENLDAAEALFALMSDATPAEPKARALIRQIDELPAIGELTLRLQQAARAWYGEQFHSK